MDEKKYDIYTVPNMVYNIIGTSDEPPMKLIPVWTEVESFEPKRFIVLIDGRFHNGLWRVGTTDTIEEAQELAWDKSEQNWDGAEVWDTTTGAVLCLSSKRVAVQPTTEEGD